MHAPDSRNDRYLAYLIDAIRAAAMNPPQLGTGRPVSLSEFKTLYGADPFYSWLGLDSSLLYSAHHASAAMTSLYRKLGDGCQELWRAIIRDEFCVEDEQAKWSYSIPKENGTATIRELDGYIDILDFPNTEALARFSDWLLAAKSTLGAKVSTRGAVFEVRQGYKSQDAKRASGDVDNGVRIALQRCLPVLVVFSTQLPRGIDTRYEAAGWLILRGTRTDNSLQGTYAFSKDVMGFDLAGWLEEQAPLLRTETERVFAALLGEQE